MIEGKKIKLRKWKNGDYFQPLGMVGKKKISDFLIDEKIDFFTKQNQMVVTANNKIIWVCGHRLSDIVKVFEIEFTFVLFLLAVNSVILSFLLVPLISKVGR